MTAAAVLLDRCRALGIALAAGPAGVLCWEADADPPADLLDALAAHKAEVLATLDERDVCRLIEEDRGLPPGTLRLYTPGEFLET